MVCLQPLPPPEHRFSSATGLKKTHSGSIQGGHRPGMQPLHEPIYGVAPLLFLKRMQVAGVPDALAPACADDTVAAGKAVLHSEKCLSCMSHHGPRWWGHFTDPGKSWHICNQGGGRGGRSAGIPVEWTWTSSTLAGRDTWVASSGATRASQNGSAAYLTAWVGAAVGPPDRQPSLHTPDSPSACKMSGSSMCSM